VGEIINLMSVDIQCISEFLPNLQLLWSAPLQVIVAIVSLYFSMGISIFAGVGIMIAMIPVHAYLGGWTRTLQVKQMAFKDSRTKIINEVLHGIKVHVHSEIR
jgi:ATP-binding cassette subfamily C (CFTR/MRP) protein 3